MFRAILSSMIKDDKKNLNGTNIGQAGFFSNIAEARISWNNFPMKSTQCLVRDSHDLSTIVLDSWLQVMILFLSFSFPMWKVCLCAWQNYCIYSAEILVHHGLDIDKNKKMYLCCYLLWPRTKTNNVVATLLS